MKIKKAVVATLLFHTMFMWAMESPHLAQENSQTIDGWGLFYLPNEMSAHIITFLWNNIAQASIEQELQTDLQTIARLKQVNRNFNSFIKQNYEKKDNGLKNSIACALARLNIPVSLHDPEVVKTCSLFLMRTFCQITDVNAINEEGKTPLVYAIENGHPDAIKKLIQAGAWVDLQDKNGDTALTWAIAANHLEIFYELMYKKANVNVQNKAGKTPLILAIDTSKISYGHRNQMVRQLIKAGARVDLPDNNGATPFMIAAEFDRAEIIEHLVDMQAVKKTQEIKAFAAHQKGRKPIQVITCGSLIDKKNEDWLTPLMMSAQKGHIKTLKALIDQGALVNAQGKFGKTALMEAAKHGRTEIIIELMEQGALIDMKENYDQTALMYAASGGSVNAVKTLLAHGAQVNSTTKQGDTSLHCAACFGHVEITKELIKHGARLYAENNDGKNALHWAAENGHADTVKLLLQKATEREKNDTKLTRIAKFFLFKFIECRDIHGQTALAHAAENGHTNTITVLLQEGAYINTTTAGGTTPLMWAAANGHTDTVKELIKKGADVGVRSYREETALMRAAENGHTDVVKEFIKIRGVIEKQGSWGLVRAHERKHTDIVNLLQSQGVSFPLRYKIYQWIP